MIAAKQYTVVSLSTDRSTMLEGRISYGNWSRTFKVRKVTLGCEVAQTDTSRPLTPEQVHRLFHWVLNNRPQLLEQKIVDFVAELQQEYKPGDPGTPGMFVKCEQRDRSKPRQGRVWKGLQ